MTLRKQFKVILLSGQDWKIDQKRLKEGAEGTDKIRSCVLLGPDRARVARPRNNLINYPSKEILLQLGY